MDLTKLIISKTEYIKIHFEELETLNFEEICFQCYKIDIDYIDEKKNLCIRFGYDDISEVCYFFNESQRVTRLLNDEMRLYESGINDLGLEINRYFEGLSKSNDCFKYLFFSNSHKQIRPYYNSWLYNDRYGNIVFEITPFYPWHDPKLKNNANFISYEKWIKDYKSIVKITVSVESLKRWVQQVKKWCKILEKCEHGACS